MGHALIIIIIAIAIAIAIASAQKLLREDATFLFPISSSNKNLN
jgi:hypothetical protein